MVQWLRPPSKEWGVGSILGHVAKIPCGSQPKNQNIKQKQNVTDLIKTLKMVHIKKKKSLKKFYLWLCHALEVAGGIFVASCGIFSCCPWTL